MYEASAISIPTYTGYYKNGTQHGISKPEKKQNFKIRENIIFFAK